MIQVQENYLALFKIYCVNNSTGRPVAPLLFPESQAVPAISRWAQWYFSVKRDRKQAAVTVPASRPPILAISANGLLSCCWYSSHKGNCHARSPASSPACNKSLAKGINQWHVYPMQSHRHRLMWRYQSRHPGQNVRYK